MTPLTRDQVRHIVGDIDDFTLARILATQASEEDLREAISDVEHDLRFGERPASSPNATVSRLRTILSDVAVDDEEAMETD
jgi:hypothetical protein